MNITEQLSPGPEQSKDVEVKPEKSTEKTHIDKEELETKTDDSEVKIEALKQKAQHEAKSGAEINIEDNQPVQRQTMINKELKLLALKRTLVRLRSQLSRPQRKFSEFVHQPTVDKTSRIAEKTVGRPYGILMGGITSLAGSSILLYTAKHYGFSYNLSVFIILFVAGYFVGLIIEALVKVVKKKKR